MSVHDFGFDMQIDNMPRNINSDGAFSVRSVRRTARMEAPILCELCEGCSKRTARCPGTGHWTMLEELLVAGGAEARPRGEGPRAGGSVHQPGRSVRSCVLSTSVVMWRPGGLTILVA